MSKKTFEDLLDISYKRAVARGCEPATLRGYRYQAERFLCPALGDKKLGKLRPEHFEKLYARMSREGLAPSTIRKCHTTAGIALKHAERKRWVRTNVARLADLPKGDPRPKVWPTPEQVEAFQVVAAERDRDMYDLTRIIAATGVRPGEACALMQDDLDGLTLTVQRALDVCQGKARIKCTKTRTIRRFQVDEETAEIIRCRPSPYLWGGHEPQRTDLVSKRFRRVARRAKVSFTPRNLRHYHATQLIAAGVDLETVAARLGHANSHTTAQFYLTAVPANDVKAAAVMGELMRR